MIKRIALALSLGIAVYGCAEKVPISAQKERTVDMVITITGKNISRGGWTSYIYRIEGYTTQKVTTDSINSDCPNIGNLSVGKQMIVPIPIYKSSTYPTGYIDPPIDPCYIATIAKPYKATT